jgi:hypothetical protein
MNASADQRTPPVLPPRPEPPRPEDCCGSDCAQCVYVLYDMELAKWEREVERILADAAKSPSAPANASTS